MKVKMIVSAIALVLILGGAMVLYRGLAKSAASGGTLTAEAVRTEESGTAVSEAVPNAEPVKTPEAKTDNRKSAPDFSVFDSEGNEVKLSDLRGKPVVLNFWASWCPPCRAEMPEFNKTFGEIGGDVQFMMVNLTDGSRETQETAGAYVSDNGFAFPVYFDLNQDAAAEYRIRGIPTSIFIDKDGYIVTQAEGSMDGESLRSAVATLTAES